VSFFETQRRRNSWDNVCPAVLLVVPTLVVSTDKLPAQRKAASVDGRVGTEDDEETFAVRRKVQRFSMIANIGEQWILGARTVE